MATNVIPQTVDKQNALEQIASHVVGEDRRLAGLIRNKHWENSVKVEAINHPKSWRLVNTNNDGEVEELVFTIYGYLLDKTLPPLNTKPKTNPSRYKFLKQGVTIDGLNTPTFRDSVSSAAEIYGLFDRTFAEGTLESWSCGEGSTGGGDTMHASNRYLTPILEAAGAKHEPFSPLVDPKGILEAMAKEGYVQTEDNVVQYSKRKSQADGSFSYEDIGPQAFRVGDIVEIQVSYVVVPLKDDKAKMVTILRSISLIQARTKDIETHVPSNKVTLKRRVGHPTQADQGKTAKPAEVLIDNNKPTEMVIDNVD